ncbi:hypothetical protein FG95_03036 [Sphingopyxis sp. LC363]|nr:hypothetical protein FG95_03036 [Sphingopyxis sp. LC363]
MQRRRARPFGEFLEIADFIERPRDRRQPGVGEALAIAVGDGQPGEEVERLSVLTHAGDIIARPVEAGRQIGERHRGALRRRAARRHRQRRLRGQPRGHAVVENRFGNAGAAQGFVTRRCLQHDRPRRTRADDRLLLGNLARRATGAADMDAVAERAVKQAGGRQQRRVAIFLHHPAGQAGDDRRYRDHAFGDAFESHRRLARGKIDRPRLGDQCETLEPVGRNLAALVAAGVTKDADRDFLGGERGHRGLRRRRGCGEHRQQERPAAHHRPRIRCAFQRWR